MSVKASFAWREYVFIAVESSATVPHKVNDLCLNNKQK